MSSTEGGPEFDGFAHDYSAGCDARLKSLIGSSPERFLTAKLDLLLPRLADAGLSKHDEHVQYLDYGCGTGEFLTLLRQRSVRWRMEGCDVSAGMLREATRRHPGLTDTAGLWNCSEAPVQPESYHVITLICVLHHVPPHMWTDKLRELWQGLRPGGCLCVIEHNPKNPITRFMVAREPIDEHATLIDQTTLQTLLGTVGSPDIATTNFLFVPPNLNFLRGIERMLTRVPWGGQYMAIATKPGRPADTATEGAREGWDA